ncbi:amidohydrolase family protein [Candidatus Dependentiae bacterium]|nr:amidohydrolase family protein [Candidatus Dependentiae bacterium]
MKTLLKNCRLVLENRVADSDLLIENDRISKISDNIKSAGIDNTIDIKKKIVFPGAVDPHIHLELNLGPGRMSSDTFESGTAAALNGGVTTVFDFAHQELPGETLLNAYQRSKKNSVSAKNRLYFHSGIMNLSDNLEEQIDRVFKAGVKSFKIYMNSVKTNSEFLYRAIKKISSLKGKILLHCEDAVIIEYLKKKLHNENKRGCGNIPASRPDYLELYSIANAAILAENLDAEIYVVHLSTASGAEYIKQMQKQGVKISAETCAQYLLLTDDIYKKKDGFLFTCTPPFRKKRDNEVLWDSIKNETIKFISTDHCPFLKKQKQRFSGSFVDYVYGLPGVEFSPVLMISEMRKRKFDYSKISRLLSTNAAKYFELYPEIGVIKAGSKADLFVYNPDCRQKLSCRNWKTNCDFYQFENRVVDGKIEIVIFDGEIVKNIG